MASQFPIYDLRAAGSNIETVNSGIVKMLDQLIEFTKKTTDRKDRARNQWRIASFIKGRDAISRYPREILSGKQAQKDIDGVGKGIADRID
jgi:hypothetical protein